MKMFLSLVSSVILNFSLKTCHCIDVFFLFFIQTLTVYDILKDDKKIEVLCPNIDLETVNFPQLLIWELEAYSLSG
jgi:hypothetical protein